MKKEQVKYIGESRIMDCGEECSIIAYRKSDDIDIQFKDGLILKNCSYSDFLDNKIKHPTKKISIRRKRKGRSEMMKCGMHCTIISYKTSSNIDIKFEDGVVLQNQKYNTFDRKYICHPGLSNKLGKQTVFHGFDVKAISYTDNATYYRAKCKYCELDDILTPQQMIEHEEENHLKRE